MAVLCKAIVVIPRFHDFYQLVHGVVKVTVGGIIRQHLAHFLFREACHFIELRREGVVSADVESAGKVVHGYGAYACYEAALDAGISSGLHRVEKGAQIALAVSLVGVAVQAFGVGEDGIGKVVILVDEEINLLIRTFTFMIEEVQLLHGSLFFIQSFQNALRQILLIHITEIIETGVAVRIQPLAVVVQFAAYDRKVEIEHQIRVTVPCGVLPYVEASEQVFELVAGTHIIIMLQHVQRQTLAGKGERYIFCS